MKISANNFWKWFKKNNERFLILNNEDVTKDVKEQLLDEFLEELHRYCEHLYFEMGGTQDAAMELIITADGNVDYFDKVDELINCAPAIDKWAYTAFMQPQDLDYTSNFEDVQLKPLEIWFLPLESKSKPKSLGFRVCTPNYEEIRDSEWLDAAVYRVLDKVIGEKMFALDVEFIEVDSLPDNPEERGMMELKDLPAFIKRRKKKLAAL